MDGFRRHPHGTAQEVVYKVVYAATPTAQRRCTAKCAATYGQDHVLRRCDGAVWRPRFLPLLGVWFLAVAAVIASFKPHTRGPTPPLSPRRLGVGVEVIITPDCTFYIGNY